MSVVIIAVSAISRVSVAIRRVGSSTTPWASTPTDTPNIRAAVIPDPITTVGRKRAAEFATGRTIHGRAGLASPPLSATATARSARIMRCPSAATSSGRSDLSRRHSTVPRTTAVAPNSSRYHQLRNGAVATTAIPHVRPASVRALRTRSPASSARARCSSVGHSQELILSIPPLLGSRRFR